MHSSKGIAPIIFDLDDTLIKNSVYFRQVKAIIAESLCLFIPTLSESCCISKFDEVEISNIKSGKKPGHDNFRISLMQASIELAGYTFFEKKLYSLVEFQIAKLSTMPVEFIEGVENVIQTLHARGHKLFILSKGNQKEQEQKLRNSGISEYFTGVSFVEKKDVECYEAFTVSQKIDCGNAYMVGNSPKSDINPAKTAGLRTIFIGNSNTWSFEQEEILVKEPKTIVLNSINDIIDLEL